MTNEEIEEFGAMLIALKGHPNPFVASVIKRWQAADRNERITIIEEQRAANAAIVDALGIVGERFAELGRKIVDGFSQVDISPQ